MTKPNAKTNKKFKEFIAKKKDIKNLLFKIQNEGSIEYAFCHYGLSENLKKIKDDKLTELSDTFIKSYRELDKYLEQLANDNDLDYP